MSKNVASSSQLSWFDIVEPVQVDEDDLTTKPEQFIPVAGYPHMPEYFVKEQRWANGDTSPEDLEHLLYVNLTLPEIFRDGNKDIFKYLPISGAIIGKRVWVAYRFHQKLVRYIPHPADVDDSE